MWKLIKNNYLPYKPISKVLFLFIVIILCDISVTDAQGEDNLIICHISELEGQRDPKCHATASRLEDFMYGTPLSFEARNERINIQKKSSSNSG